MPNQARFDGKVGVDLWQKERVLMANGTCTYDKRNRLHILEEHRITHLDVKIIPVFSDLS